jgi:hypothetical protein
LDEGDVLVDVARLIPEDEATSGATGADAAVPSGDEGAPSELAPAGSVDEAEFTDDPNE